MQFGRCGSASHPTLPGLRVRGGKRIGRGARAARAEALTEFPRDFWIPDTQNPPCGGFRVEAGSQPDQTFVCWKPLG
ncbi:hypothetical protein LUTEI9C_150012 [Luteimonas sp. 9C]|nr:hypothetical protein LUTEI9C_150012 [Luteimonas sp. 9C]